MKLCKECVNLIEDKEDIELCDECISNLKVENMKDALDFSKESEIYKEFVEFIKSRFNQSVLYAYSGGQDSTAVLCLLKEMCDKYHVTLNVFTIENGFKGEKTWDNIYRVIKELELEDNYKVYDIRDQVMTDEKLTNIFGEGHTAEEIYALSFMNNILPCGKICNTILDNQYKRILEDENEEYLITGGDTPKISNNRYSVFWTKPNGLKIVRGGAGLRITKNIGKQILEEYQIPWENPNYGGYDTDCLVPGSIFASISGGDSEITKEKMKELYPVVLEYLKERSRLKIIDRQDAIEALEQLDLNDYSGYIEMKNTSAKVLRKSLMKNV